MISYYKSDAARVCKSDSWEEGCWINVIAPTEGEITELTEKYKVNPEFIRSSLDEEESSRIENDEDQTFLIFDVPFAEKDGDNVIYTTMPVGIVVTKTDIITISLRDNPVICDFEEGIVKNAKPTHRTQFVLYILFRMATRFLQYLKQIDKHSSFLESQLRKSMRNKELVQLLDLEKSLVYFQTSLKSNEMTLEKILRGRYLKLYDDDQELLEDVLIEVKQAIDMANIYLSILSGTMDAFASVISNNLNIVMKVLTSITILMAIPTMIFSFYGMNIGTGDALPFNLNIWFPLGISVALTAVVGFILYKKDMF